MRSRSEGPVSLENQRRWSSAADDGCSHFLVRSPWTQRKSIWSSNTRSWYTVGRIVLVEEFMKIFNLMRAHGEWVVHLREALYGDGAPSLLMAADDEACQLGQWLRDLEGEFRDLPEYESVKATHAHFHRRAAYCMDLIDAGRRRDALAETEDEGELRRLSRMLVQAIQQLRRVMPAGAEAEPNGQDKWLD